MKLLQVAVFGAFLSVCATEFEECASYTEQMDIFCTDIYVCGQECVRGRCRKVDTVEFHNLQVLAKKIYTKNPDERINPYLMDPLNDSLTEKDVSGAVCLTEAKSYILPHVAFNIFFEQNYWDQLWHLGVIHHTRNIYANRQCNGACPQHSCRMAPYDQEIAKELSFYGLDHLIVYECAHYAYPIVGVMITFSILLLAAFLVSIFICTLHTEVVPSETWQHPADASYTVENFKEESSKSQKKKSKKKRPRDIPVSDSSTAESTVD